MLLLLLLVCVMYPWNDRFGNSYTGIPPHIAVLQELACIRKEQKTLVDSFVDKVKQAIDESGLSGSGVTEQRLQTMFESFAIDLRTQLDSVTATVMGNGGPQQRERVETGRGYQWHHYDGQIHRVPKSWRFPRCGVLDAWRQWWVGDTVRNIPPLRVLHYQDVAHIDKLPLSEEEMHGRVGKFMNQRRPVRKTLNDLKFLMEFMTQKIVETNAMPAEITLTSVDAMYQVALPHVFPEGEATGGRNEQKKWNSVVFLLRKSMKVTL